MCWPLLLFRLDQSHTFNKGQVIGLSLWDSGSLDRNRHIVQHDFVFFQKINKAFDKGKNGSLGCFLDFTRLEIINN